MQSASVVRNAAVWVAALGYFVDIYDLLLFSIVRVPSLDDLGVADATLHGTLALGLNGTIVHIATTVAVG